MPDMYKCSNNVRSKWRAVNIIERCADVFCATVSIQKCLLYGSSKSERLKFFDLVRVLIRCDWNLICRQSENTNTSIKFVKQVVKEHLAS